MSVILFSWVYKLEELTILSNHWKKEEEMIFIKFQILIYGFFSVS